MPLVAAPLAILLLSALLETKGSSKPLLYGIAQGGQPVAAAMVLASFFAQKGPIAGGLVAAWLALTVLLAIGGMRRVKSGTGGHLFNASWVAAHMFLLVGAAWLLLSRLGVGPRNFAALTVFLAAVHFHYSGFTLQILIAATGQRLQDRGSRLGALHRGLAVGAIVGIPLIAAGNIFSSRSLKFLGVLSMVLSTLAFAITSTAVALNSRSSLSRRFLLVSAASIAGGMALAGVYGVGELSGTNWLPIPEMVAIHGFVNALGFTLCGLLGHLQLVAPVDADDRYR
jgi:hypothetical protein